MSIRVNVKPLMHWLIYRHYTVRITKRTPTEVEGLMTTPEGQVNLRYDPTTQTVYLPSQTIAINEYGWEIDPPAE
jgi:hypothetical protein